MTIHLDVWFPKATVVNGRRYEKGEYYCGRSISDRVFIWDGNEIKRATTLDEWKQAANDIWNRYPGFLKQVVILEGRKNLAFHTNKKL